jgi:hypothetical protein
MTLPVPVYDDAAIVRIGAAMFDRTLPKAEWTHAAHFATAIWVIAARPDLVPSRDLPPAIRAYNEATGVANTDTDGYHETITQASICAAAAFVRDRPGWSLAALCGELLGSGLGRSDWLLAYWSRPVLFSAAARRNWVEPDIGPFPYETPAP